MSAFVRRVASRRNNGSLGGSTITLAGLTAEEFDHVEGMLAGHWRLSCVEGRLQAAPVHKAPPDPIEDPKTGPNWPTVPSNQLDLNAVVPQDHKPTSVSIWIGHLCGYGWTPEAYAVQADLLTEMGFVPLRSPRGLDGHFWEFWFLPGLWSARGPLKFEVESLRRKREPKLTDDGDIIGEVVRFLCRRAVFGTLDIAIQRAAMAIPD